MNNMSLPVIRDAETSCRDSATKHSLGKPSSCKLMLPPGLKPSYLILPSRTQSSIVNMTTSQSLNNHPASPPPH